MIVIQTSFNTLYVVGSKRFVNYKGFDDMPFQYIICRWFKILRKGTKIRIILFQYIICRWFKMFQQ